ncbi:nuclear transport factor 2 family protein [Rhodococcus sp. IEGM 1379]|uniref:nuclear transport factor 2 family protein n=1 Tax=Rhodococcus sp. IEGM 1379 TaxID=3047086 RepID=UPI0024B76E53|nr:nuclear transport factor 2 family protein [Rhodococcus sp. IEGM 1379]MDI9917299.1 nuclear transport factor 2 family protein [Rhodococcus sp. IEGM 1379]
MSNTIDSQKVQLVEEMLQIWENLEFDKATALFAEDGVLHSVMQDPHVGRSAIAKRMDTHTINITEMKFCDRTIGVIDGRVFVQRVDNFIFQGNRITIPVVGVFSIEHGLITEWLEYYDRETIMSAKNPG